MDHPVLERNEILFWLKRFRELDTTKLSHRRRLIDSFVNFIVLYDLRNNRYLNLPIKTLIHIGDDNLARICKTDVFVYLALFYNRT